MRKPSFGRDPPPPFLQASEITGTPDVQLAIPHSSTGVTSPIQLVQRALADKQKSQQSWGDFSEPTRGLELRYPFITSGRFAGQLPYLRAVHCKAMQLAQLRIAEFGTRFGTRRCLELTPTITISWLIALPAPQPDEAPGTARLLLSPPGYPGSFGAPAASSQVRRAAAARHSMPLTEPALTAQPVG